LKLGLRARLVVATVVAVVIAVVTVSVGMAMAGAEPSVVAGWAAIGLAVGTVIGAGLIVVSTHLPLLMITAVSRGLHGVTDNQAAAPLPVAGAGTADLARAFNVAIRATELRLGVIRQGHAQLEAILLAMADGVVIVDENEIVLLMNPAVGSLLDVDIEKAPGRSLPDAVRDHEVVALCQRAHTDQATASEVLSVGAVGRPVQVLATPIGLGEARQVLLLLRDLTEVQATMAARRDFVANVSHELRTPVTSLKALVESLEAGASDDPELRPDFLRHISVEVDRLASMTAELLDLAAAESGRRVSQFELVEFCDLVRQSVDRLRPQAERGGVSLAVDAASTPIVVNADPVQIDRMVINLLHNAIKFTPPGGHVGVSVQAENGEVLVRVQDTGQGVAPEDLPRIFERFYKADPSRSGEGTGLGLAIAKHTVLQHGGRIWAESEGLGHGSLFAVAFRIANGS
jgi:two-component system phosphate regulon sensor histidine kinase PhoR